ncbi:MAG: hypothetical protein ACP6IY_00335 [Promethearchaeia archaeon]
MLELEFNPKSYGLKKDNLYEIIATGFLKKYDTGAIIPNASCMGIRLLENDLISIKPFHKTNTYEILETMGLITINFVERIDLYAFAALKMYFKDKNDKNQEDHNNNVKRNPEESKIFKIERGFPEYLFNNFTFISRDSDSNHLIDITLPYLKNSWGVLFCKAIDEKISVIKDDFGKIKRSEFKLKVLSSKKFKESYKIFNRAENLALEAIILATRIKIAELKNDKKNYEEKLNLIKYYINEIERFGRNEYALRAIRIIKSYLNI